MPKLAAKPAKPREEGSMINYYLIMLSISRLMSSRLTFELLTRFYLDPREAWEARPLFIPLDLAEVELPLKLIAELRLLVELIGACFLITFFEMALLVADAYARF